MNLSLQREREERNLNKEEGGRSSHTYFENLHSKKMLNAEEMDRA